MTLLFYTVGIYLLQAGLYIGSLFSQKIKKLASGQIATRKLISSHNTVFRHDEGLVWMHCASLGEFEQGRMVLELLKKERPRIKIALSFFSPSGFDIRKNWPGADVVFYLPSDTPANAKSLIKWLNPDICLLVKYDFWWNHLNQLKNAEIPVYLVAAHFEKDRYYFKRPFIQIMKEWRQIFTMRQSSFDTLRNLGFTNVQTVGDPRLDRVISIRNQGMVLPEDLTTILKKNPPVYVYGSIYVNDLPIILPIIENRPNILHIVVPHEIHPLNILHCKNQFRSNVDIFSEGLSGNNIVIIDKIGLLAGIYAFAECAYIGGGFGKGIHNILEPAVYDIPVFFGPVFHSFPEAVELIQDNKCFTISNTQELESGLNEVEKSKHRFTEKDSIPAYFKKHAGASEKILHFILRENFNQ